MSKQTEIVIVGAGAGGLELAIRLSRFRRKEDLSVTLIDESLNYIWKPLYHEVAVGTVDYQQNEINYISYSHKKHIKFVLGSIQSLDRDKKTITISPVCDDNHQVVIESRIQHYDILVLAIGSISNTYRIEGVADHCFFLDRLQQAERFQRFFLYRVLRFIQNGLEKTTLSVVIVGAGATGVELAAELQYAVSSVIRYGSRPLDLTGKLKIYIIESADRILPNLSTYISDKVTTQLTDMGITLLTNKKVIKATQEGVETSDNQFVNADIIVWAAGIKAPEVLSQLGLATNQINQVIVNSSLQTVSDPNIFAIGDCAACPDGAGNMVPPRAQAARQQAIHLANNIVRFINNKPLTDYHYRDYGSLVSLSQHQVVGNLMGKTLGSFFIEGKIARLSYLMLQKEHQRTLFGFWKSLLLTLSNLFTRRIKSGIKLH